MYVKKVVRELKTENLFSVKDRSVFITGAGGLGSFLARGFLANGAKVVLANRSLEKAEKVKTMLKEEGYGQCEAYQMDQTDKRQIQETVDAIVKSHGRIDILINTAALCWNEDTADFQEEGIRRMVEINIVGAMLLTQVVGKNMIEQRAGKIIEIGSIGGLECHSYCSMPYEATKAAVHQMTKSFATAWAEYNINVNCIAPTWIDTPMVAFAEGKTREAIIGQHLFGRIAEVEDFLGAALFLASDASNYMTGQVIAVDGGWSVSKPWKLLE